MKQEDKELLLKDLCARLPYGVKIQVVCSTIHTLYCHKYDTELESGNLYLLKTDSTIVRPYLRTMSSMTEEEKEEYKAFFNYDGVEYPEEYIDWLNAHHFDYRGLIEKGLALEAPVDMYK